MDNKEIILSKIAEILSRKGFFFKSNSQFKSRLKCVGLGEYFDKYADYLIPYYYNNGYAHKFENSNEEYDVFLGLDSIFADLYRENKNGEIISLLKELTKSFNVPYISETLHDDFEELANLYELLGLSIRIEVDRVIVTTCMASNEQRVMLHSVTNPQLNKQDSVSKDYQVKDTYDLILANPPFKGTLNKENISESLSAITSTTKTELLFVRILMHRQSLQKR